MRGEIKKKMEKKTATKMENEKRQVKYRRKDNKMRVSNKVIHFVFPV
jgi:hypothetical protein